MAQNHLLPVSNYNILLWFMQEFLRFRFQNAVYKIFWETLWAIWFFLLRFVKWGVSPIWGTPLFWWGLCKIVQPHFVRLSYEDKATVNWTAKEAFPHFWGYLPRIGEMCSILSESFFRCVQNWTDPCGESDAPCFTAEDSATKLWRRRDKPENAVEQ